MDRWSREPSSAALQQCSALGPIRASCPVSMRQVDMLESNVAGDFAWPVPSGTSCEAVSELQCAFAVAVGRLWAERRAEALEGRFADAVWLGAWAKTFAGGVPFAAEDVGTEAYPALRRVAEAAAAERWAELQRRRRPRGLAAPLCREFAPRAGDFPDRRDDSSISSASSRGPSGDPG